MWMMPVLADPAAVGHRLLGAFGESTSAAGRARPAGARSSSRRAASSCHGAQGEGGVGPPLAGGEVANDLPRRGRPRQVGAARARCQDQGPALRRPGPRGRPAHRRPRAGCRPSPASSPRRRSRPSSTYEREGLKVRGAMADHDVLVVGGGPSGAACAYWLAEAGHDVVVVEKKHFPREKTCGDGLTPRSVKQLDDMGLADDLAVGAHRFDGLRSIAFGRTSSSQWPERPGFPRHGYVITRHDLDHLVAERAEKAGATVLQGMRGRRAPISTAACPGARSSRTRTRATPPSIRATLHGGRRRGQLPLRPGARHVPRPVLPPGHGHPGLLHVAPPRRAVDRVPPRRPRHGRATSCPATGGSSRWATAG